MYAQTADDIECPDAWLFCWERYHRKRYPNGLIWVLVFLPDGVKNTVATETTKPKPIRGRLKTCLMVFRRPFYILSISCIIHIDLNTLSWKVKNNVAHFKICSDRRFAPSWIPSRCPRYSASVSRQMGRALWREGIAQTYKGFMCHGLWWKRCYR